MPIISTFIHKDELTVLWEVMQTDEEYFKIKGLE